MNTPNIEKAIEQTKEDIEDLTASIKREKARIKGAEYKIKQYTRELRDAEKELELLRSTGIKEKSKETMED